ncbi:MAG: TolB family protein, partial [Polyangia bacterium]
FTAGTDHGGTTQLIASYTPPGGSLTMAIATIHVRVHGVFQGPDCMGGGCATFPPDNAPACANTAITPQIFYPNDGVLLPPNMEVIAVHWTPFPAGPPVLPIQEFELDFENANTDVRVVTKCSTQLMDTANPPTATGGCEYKLDPAVWDFIAKSNRGGDAVKITVRATTDGMCATPSMTSVNMAFGEQDVNGGIFYWKSSITAGGVGGNIWAKAFGNAIPEEQVTGVAGTNLANATCFGCHALSRDGKRMVVNFDDADSDDEYGDVVHTLMDVLTKNSLDGHNTYGHFEPGFQAIAPDTSIYVATNGDGTNPSNVFFMFDAMTGMPLAPASTPIGPAMVGATPARPTMPDWAPDGKSLIYVQPEHVGVWDGTSRNDDNHVFGGTLMSATYDPMAKTFGTPTAVITSAGENNFYPGYSPDGTFIAFNRVPKQTVTNPIAGRPDCTGTGMQVTCPNDSFSNPKSRVLLLSTKPGAMPVDAENANGSPASAPVDVSNSWPRWSPFVQAYKGDKLLWITFSSTRDYGLRVRNHKAGMYQCYPADSLEQAGAAHNQAFDVACQQPQIWMAAINLSHLEFNTTDPSFVAFWLPFQAEVDAMGHPTHNHTAQWTQTVVDQPPPDMAACIPSGGMCTPGGTPCCAGGCFGGICGIP